MTNHTGNGCQSAQEPPMDLQSLSEDQRADLIELALDGLDMCADWAAEDDPATLLGDELYPPGSIGS
jgi:hypothetical protein